MKSTNLSSPLAIFDFEFNITFDFEFNIRTKIPGYYLHDCMTCMFYYHFGTCGMLHVINTPKMQYFPEVMHFYMQDLQNAQKGCEISQVMQPCK